MTIWVSNYVAWWIYRKMQKTNDEMIKQIEEISKEQLIIENTSPFAFGFYFGSSGKWSEL